MARTKDDNAAKRRHRKEKGKFHMLRFLQIAESLMWMIVSIKFSARIGFKLTQPFFN